MCYSVNVLMGIRNCFRGGKINSAGFGIIGAGIIVLSGAPAFGQLFVGLEGSAPATQSTDLSGFPNVVWTNHFKFDVSGAAARPDGLLYLCNGAFSTDLYSSTLGGPPKFLSRLQVDMSSLAYGRGKLYGYSNFAATKGIYEIDPATGVTTLVLDVFTNTGFRFFALDYNPVDDLFYGYTEFGDTGLYSINIDTGEMLKIVGVIPASNGQGRGLAVGRNTVYLTATRGDDGIPCFSYDLSQGANGQWQSFTQPYPTFHSTGGAAYIPQPGLDITVSVGGNCPGRLIVEAMSATPGSKVAFVYAFGAGSVIIPNGVCAGTELGLDGSVLLAAQVTADASGTAVLSRNVPAGACGGHVFIQAIDLDTCTPSNVVQTP